MDRFDSCIAMDSPDVLIVRKNIKKGKKNVEYASFDDLELETGGDILKEKTSSFKCLRVYIMVGIDNERENRTHSPDR